MGRQKPEKSAASVAVKNEEPHRGVKRAATTYCPHVNSTGHFSKEDIAQARKLTCSLCGEGGPRARWICLHPECCQDIKTAVFCGNKDGGDHMNLHHNEKKEHVVVLSASNHRLLCLECEIEISREHNVPEISSELRRCILKRPRQTSREREDCSPPGCKAIKESNPSIKSMTRSEKTRGAPLEKEATVSRPLLKHMEDGFEDDFPKGLTGLRNLINTCYFNAAVQCLSNCPPFADFFRDKGDLRPYSLHEPAVSNQLALVIQRLWSPTRSPYINPEFLLHSIRERYSQFRGWAQQDAQELIRCLLEQVHKEMGQPVYRHETVDSAALPCGGKSRRHSSSSSGGSDQFETPDSGWSSDGDDPSTSNDSRSERKGRAAEKESREPVAWKSIVTDVFDGKIESNVKCLTCKSVSTTTETFQDLSLPIPTKEQLARLNETMMDEEHSLSPSNPETNGVSWWSWISSLFISPPISLQDCLSAFFSPDRLVGDDMYSCEKCKKLRNGVKTCRIVRSPEVLSVHIKRFRHEAFSSSKVSTRVSFPLMELDISQFCSPDEKNTIYDLCGFVTHEGGGMDSGHYLAYCRNEVDGNWYEYDDMTVTKLDTGYVLTKEAYVLFYQKRSSPEIERVRVEVAHAVAPTTNIKVNARSYISTEWLLKLNTFADPGPISNYSFLCRHGHILPRRANHISDLSTVLPSSLVDELYKEFGGGPRVDKLHYCLRCDKRWQWLTEKKKNERMQWREIEEAVRAATYSGEEVCLYQAHMPMNVISKTWLQSWERFVSDPVAEPPGEIDNSALLVTNEEGVSVMKHSSSLCKKIPRELYLFLLSCYGGGPEVILTPEPQPSEEELAEMVREAEEKMAEAKCAVEERLNKL